MPRNAELTGSPEGFDPAVILKALATHSVDYVLIGGVAAVLHGVPTVTTDIDVVPARSEDNIDRLIACLTALEGVRTTEPDEAPSAPKRDDLRYRIEQFDTAAGPVDVIFEAKRIGGYERLVTAALPMDVADVVVRVAAMDDLILAKQWSDRPKDRVHLRLLLAVKRASDRGDR